MANEDKSTRYHRLRRRARLLAAGWQVIFLLAILLTGLSTTIRAGLESAVGTGLVPLVPLYVLVLAALYEVVHLPLAVYQGIVLEHRYGLSTETRAQWWSGYVKAAVIVLAGLVAAALLASFLLRWSPVWWWVAAAAAFTAILVLLARFVPAVLLPLFSDVRPLTNQILRRRLVALAERAGAPVLDVFEWHVGDHTKKANAALAGVGRGRRILISDTLLEGHSDEEIETVIAHELAHHVYRDIWSAMALDAVLIASGLYLADAMLTAAAVRLGLDGKADVAGLPLLLLAGGVMSLVLRPVANALSRSHERRADRYALELTGNPAAFISAMRRLAARNMAEERPSPLVELLFHTHPSTAARIEAARTWSPDRAS